VLAEYRNACARALAGDAAEKYEDVFAARVRRRFPGLALELD